MVLHPHQFVPERLRTHPVCMKAAHMSVSSRDIWWSLGPGVPRR